MPKLDKLELNGPVMVAFREPGRLVARTPDGRCDIQTAFGLVRGIPDDFVEPSPDASIMMPQSTADRMAQIFVGNFKACAATEFVDLIAQGFTPHEIDANFEAAYALAARILAGPSPAPEAA